MNDTRRDQTDCANFSSASDGGTERLPWLPEAASCQFWIIAHNEALLPVSVVLILPLFLTSLVANTLLLMALWHSEDLSCDPRYKLVKSLSVSNLLLSISLAPSMLHSVFHHLTPSFSGWCLAQFFTSTMAIITSLLTVTFMALERYVYICEGIRYPAIITNSRINISVFFSWLMGLIGAGISVVLVLRGRTEFGHAMSGFMCELSVVQAQIEQPLYFETFNKVFFGCLLFFCLLVFLFSYGRMYQVARQAQEPFRQDNVRARGTVALYLGIFVLQLFPSMMNFITLFGEDMNNHLLLSVLVLVPPCVNPFAYGIRNMEVRQALQHLWRGRWGEGVGGGVGGVEGEGERE